MEQIMWLLICLAVVTAILFFRWMNRPKPTKPLAKPNPIPTVNRIRAGRIAPPPMRQLPRMRVTPITSSAPASRQDDSDFLTGAMNGMLVREVFNNYEETGRSCLHVDSSQTDSNPSN